MESGLRLAKKMVVFLFFQQQLPNSRFLVFVNAIRSSSSNARVSVSGGGLLNEHKFE